MALEEMNRCGTVWPLRCNLRLCSVLRRPCPYVYGVNTHSSAMYKYANNTRIRRSNQQLLIASGNSTADAVAVALRSAPYASTYVIRVRRRRSPIVLPTRRFFLFIFSPNPTLRVNATRCAIRKYLP